MNENTVKHFYKFIENNILVYNTLYISVRKDYYQARVSVCVCVKVNIFCYRSFYSVISHSSHKHFVA